MLFVMLKENLDVIALDVCAVCVSSEKMRDVSMSMCAKNKFIRCVLWLYDFTTMTTTATATTTKTPLKFIISMLHRIFKAAFPFGGWHECAENLKWKFIVLLSAWQAYASVYSAHCGRCTVLCCGGAVHSHAAVHVYSERHTEAERQSKREAKFSHGAHKATSTASLRLDEWKIWTHNRLFILVRRNMHAMAFACAASLRFIRQCDAVNAKHSPVRPSIWESRASVFYIFGLCNFGS